MPRRVSVFALGGTIAMTPATSGGITPSLSAADLLAAVPGLAETGILLDVNDFRRVPGASLSFADLIELSQAITAALTNGADGATIVQGTDTIDEASYLLDLYHHRDEPLVVTGAMRSPTAAGADGAASILGAILTAASPDVAGQGVTVVLADEIHSARRVRKTHSTSTSTFQSPNGGPIGYLVESQPRFVNRAVGRFGVPLPTKEFPRIGLYTAVLGDRGELLDGAEDKLDGLVVAAMGVGHVPDRLVARLEKLAASMPVLLASRTFGGSVLRSTYGFPGSERDLISRGLIPVGLNDPLKARLLLGATIACGATRQQSHDAVTIAGGYTEPAAWPWPEPAPRSRNA